MLQTDSRTTAWVGYAVVLQHTQAEAMHSSTVKTHRQPIEQVLHIIYMLEDGGV